MKATIYIDVSRGGHSSVCGITTDTQGMAVSPLKAEHRRFKIEIDLPIELYTEVKAQSVEEVR